MDQESRNLILDTSLLRIECMALSKLLNFVGPYQVLLILLWYICISQACTDHYRLMTALTSVHPLSLFTNSVPHPNAILHTSARMFFSLKKFSLSNLNPLKACHQLQGTWQPFHPGLQVTIMVPAHPLMFQYVIYHMQQVMSSRGITGHICHSFYISCDLWFLLLNSSIICLAKLFSILQDSI